MTVKTQGTLYSEAQLFPISLNLKSDHYIVFEKKLRVSYYVTLVEIAKYAHNVYLQNAYREFLQRKLLVFVLAVCTSNYLDHAMM